MGQGWRINQGAKWQRGKETIIQATFVPSDGFILHTFACCINDV